MITKHTQGPWVAHQYAAPKGTFYICGAGNEKVLGGGTRLHEANARLIAAAPELLAALKALLQANDEVQMALCDGPDVPGWDRSALPRAQAKVVVAEALAKSIISKAEASK